MLSTGSKSVRRFLHSIPSWRVVTGQEAALDLRVYRDGHVWLAAPEVRGHNLHDEAALLACVSELYARLRREAAK